MRDPNSADATRLTRRRFIFVVGGVSLAALTGCGGEEEADVACAPEPIGDGDECAVCGMFIAGFPGPKAQACLRDGRLLKFCSTSDLFVWLLQPDSPPQLRQAYVHDMGETAWDAPSDEAYIVADTAVYVTEQPLKGAMGPTLAAFASTADAEAFMEEHGGRQLAFEEVDVATINELARSHIQRGR
ncbi:nitrous oxide reductase accessory protein NosL [Billgrantia gudaonensis]|uniref:Copper chaperone NosL n=1 Tax=Billgrantia gudaonensis TaxID=376427 RepID=A0A1G8PT39_9GAMM|nr:nitrous oxide reductase accessory protein NosL [Halomonas gudaonensis]SDI95375.1 copper chaperone NosL [Halomonas gudaonensis]